jgi:membrane-bound serine protease (ClpP class)
MQRTRRAAAVTAAVLAALLLRAAAGQRAEEPGPVVVLEVQGVIDAVVERYIERGLAHADRAGARLVVIRLDTPGGGLEPMHGIVEALLNARRPVAVYVAPAGARAASAGMFIAASAHVAAMAPGTHLGAAHPVAMGGQLDEERSRKVVNDAAAMARAIAQERDRNVEWLERAVRESISASADEAVRAQVVDLVAADLDALLAELDGREVVTAAGAVTLTTREAPVERRPMGLADRLLHALADPNIAYLLLTLGVIGLAGAAYNPGAGALPGSLGAVCLLTAFFALGTLPINWAAVLLLVLGVALVVLDALAEGLGPLSIGGVVAFVLGSLLLYRPVEVPLGAPRLSVSPWLIAVMSALLVGFVAVIAVAVVRASRQPVRTGIEALRGHEGLALSELSPRGTVAIDTEVWSATTAGETIHKGEHVRVLGIEGVTLRVATAEQPQTGEAR